MNVLLLFLGNIGTTPILFEIVTKSVYSLPPSSPYPLPPETLILFTTSFTPHTYHASASAASFWESLFTVPERVTTQFLVETEITDSSTIRSFSSATLRASLISSSVSSSGGSTSREFMTSTLPGTHQANTPQRRLWLKEPTTPSISTTASLTSILISCEPSVGSSEIALIRWL